PFPLSHLRSFRLHSTASTLFSTLSLHDALPILSYLTDPEVHALLAAPDLTTWVGRRDQVIIATLISTGLRISELIGTCWADELRDRKSTRLNSSHVSISYAVFCLKKKTTDDNSN